MSSDLISLISTVSRGLDDLGGKKAVRLPFEGRAIVVGDIHGDLRSLNFILDRFSDFSEGMLIFLGDYGDRGDRQIDVYLRVLALRAKWPDRVVLLRGNHESDEVYPHDLPDRLEEIYRDNAGKVHRAFQELWGKLPILAVGNYLMVHGGAPSSLESIDQIGDVEEEILWNDPGDIEGTMPSFRGIGKVFGEKLTRNFLELTGAKTLIRSHQPCDGVEVWHGGWGITVFSRLGEPYFNERAAYLDIDLSSRLSGYELAKTAKMFSIQDLYE
jgi:protein phosphatase